MERNDILTQELKTKLKSYVYNVVGCCQEVHREMGCWLNEYVYQDALAVCLAEKSIPFQKEYRFVSEFHGKPLGHQHQLDFLINNNIIIECKAIKEITTEQRQQLWNYMRLTKICIGILYNFAPVKDQCEKYYYNLETGIVSLF